MKSNFFEFNLGKNYSYSKKYYLINEILNSSSHFLGIILSIIGSFLLISKADNNIEKVSFCIYSLSMIVLYFSSTLYHGFYFTKYKKKLQIFDHISIYILIAGSYTPFCLLKNFHFILIIEWIIVIIGIFLKIFYFKKSEKYSLFLYLFMGWIVIFIFPKLNQSLSNKSLLFLFSAGITYSLGTIFFVFDKLKYFHFIWHLFVLLGSLMIWLSIFYI